VNSNEKIITLATVNNVSITNVDLKDEMLILKVLNDSKKIDKNTLQQSAFQNLVDQAVRQVEVESNKIKISEQVNNQMYNSIKKKLTDNGIESTKIQKKIKKKKKIKKTRN